MCVSCGTHTRDLPWDWELFQAQNELQEEHES